MRDWGRGKGREYKDFMEVQSFFNIILKNLLKTILSILFTFLYVENDEDYKIYFAKHFLSYMVESQNFLDPVLV